MSVLHQRRDATKDAAAGFMQLLQSLPAGVSPYDYIKQQLNDPIWKAQVGYFYAQTWLFIVVHAIIAVLSLLGCWKRYSRGTLWLFRRSDGYIHPNTSVLSQVCFALYSLLYIVSLSLEVLTPPSKDRPIPPYLSDIFLGLAIHFQTWATVYARPRSSSTFATLTAPGKQVLDSSAPFSRRLGPRVLNSIFILIGVAFVSTLVGGSIAMLLHKTKLMEALWTINEALDRAKATNASLTSLMSLLPTFAVFMDEGDQLGVFGRRLGQILACWGLIWLLTYPPAAISLILTLTKQERHLASSLANFHDVDALASRPPDVYRPPRTSTSSSKKIEIASSADGGSLTPGVAETVPVLVDLPSTAFGRSSASSSAVGAPRDRTAVQKAEATEKLRAVRRIKLVLLAQFCTTLIMLLVYGSLECTLFTSWFNSLKPVVMYNISETWLGWAFLVPGTFSSAAFVWASYHVRGPVSQPSRPPSHPVQAEPFLPPPAPSSVRSPTSPASNSFPPSQSTPPSSSSGRSLDRWRKFRWSNAAPSLAGTRQGEELSFVQEGEGESRKSGGWVPSVWAREKKEEAILLEVRGEAR